jgi:hypothetical protein
MTLFFFRTHESFYIISFIVPYTLYIAFDRFDSKKIILKNKNLILNKHLFVKHGNGSKNDRIINEVYLFTVIIPRTSQEYESP